jgi:glycosyltransferase involved in cell wall biosynthesis
VLKLPPYVVITPARDEAAFIELTIQSVVAQTALPLRWIVVSDGSRDGTDEIVARYAAKYPWIELIRMPERKERHFAGKAHAFRTGKARVDGLAYEVIASLDADITFEKDYFSFLLERLVEDAELGLVGTSLVDTSGACYDYRFVGVEHVCGACQVFRRQCFEAIGGYLPVRHGGIDKMAVIGARVKGWKTRTFTERFCLHHRKMGTAQCGPIQAKFQFGVKDYSIGNHPAWQLFRCAYQMTKEPVLLGGLALGAGYLWAAIRGERRSASRELIAFHRRDQMQRLKRILSRKKPFQQDSPLAPGRKG